MHIVLARKKVEWFLVIKCSVRIFFWRLCLNLIQFHFHDIFNHIKTNYSIKTPDAWTHAFVRSLFDYAARNFKGTASMSKQLRIPYNTNIFFYKLYPTWGPEISLCVQIIWSLSISQREISQITFIKLFFLFKNYF